MTTRHKVRYAVVGLGHIAQDAVLPAFAHARQNSELVALVSGDPAKRRELSRRYRVAQAVGYEDYDELLRSGELDAVYIALPNDQHREAAERAAAAGVHVLVDKPMAMSVADGRSMIRAAEASGVKVMVAYRLHFDQATLSALKLVRSGRLGAGRFVHAVLSMQVRDGDIRVQQERGGGPLEDVGIYCINAARMFFGAEPREVLAVAATGNDSRFREVDECVSGLLRFSCSRVAAFTASFGAAEVSECRIVGARGDLRMEPAFAHAKGLVHHLTIGEKTNMRRFPRHDQFAAELICFSRCILEDLEPEPSGWEGLADLRVIEALRESLREGRAVELPPFSRARRPRLDQEIRRPPVRKPGLVRARSPHAER